MQDKETARGVAALREAEGDTVGACSNTVEQAVAQRLGFRQETNLPREKSRRNDEIMFGNSMIPFIPSSAQAAGTAPYTFHIPRHMLPAFPRPARARV